jgi:DNA-binding transcriptional LysR family regulator
MRVDASGPSIEDLRTFLLLAEIGGVADVACRLGIDFSVVSRRLRPFRMRFGLLRKQGGSLVPTDRGRELLPIVRAVVHEYDRLVGTLNPRTADKLVLTIAVGRFGAIHLVPEALARFAERQPTCEVRVRSARGRERILGVMDGRFDLAIVAHSLEQIRSLLGDQPVTVEPLPVRPFVVLAHRGTASAEVLESLPHDGMVEVGVLNRLVLVGLDEGAGARIQLERRAREAVLRLHFGMSGGGWLAAREYARHGLGAAVVPVETLTDADGQELAIRHLEKSLWPRDHLLYRTTEGSRLLDLKQILIDTAIAQVDHLLERVKRLGERY